MAYYCTKCDKTHRRLSGVGVRHKEYEGEKPTRITVRPDRSTPEYTGLTIEGPASDEVESWTGINTETFTVEIDPWNDEATSATPATFTETLIDSLETLIKSFQQIPWTHTPQEIFTLRVKQTKWLRALKDLIQMQ